MAAQAANPLEQKSRQQQVKRTNMLQISTGKFFEEEKMVKHNEKFVFYSNISLPTEIELSSPIINVEEVESGSVSCYVVSYQLITEVDPLIIKCGWQDFIAQFILAWAFYFDCIAKTQKELVQKICREKKISSYDQAAASEISPKTVELGRRITLEEIESFKKFFDSLMKVNRACYKSTIAALKIIDDAKETLATNFDLGYSTLVYALESLSQKHDGYSPEWNHYDDNTRRKLKPILSDISEEHSESIKSILIDGKQFKLRKRFEAFVSENLDDEFYKTHLGKNATTLRRSFLLRCLNNLYQLRSSFVHELKPLDVMLSSPHSPSSDYIIRFGEPYFTFTGINRVARTVIVNFLVKNQTDTREYIEWKGETSSIMIAEMAAETYINDPNAFSEERSNKWFSEYVNMLAKRKVVDQSRVMEKIQNEFDGAKKEYKSPMLHYYWLYNALHNQESEEWQKFIGKHNFIGECFNFYIVILFLYYKLSYRTDDGEVEINLDEFDKDYQCYLKKRFHKHGLSLSSYIEAALLCAAANIALSSGDKERYQKYLDSALEEAASDPKNTTLILKALENTESIDMKAYFELEESK
ncbi:hypothetical protein D8T51_13345 [Vibrio vulnificus]|uniref:hypothetical protein n=1 Tax=Vibrio vulnificus TaxID=672 RepID=UPI00102A626C|nr:hypothetical protein [Vibrio vulnificus]RZP76883.1 hypothetical protein D8T51_13345 [Vibrio vulnificus]